MRLQFNTSAPTSWNIDEAVVEDDDYTPVDDGENGGQVLPQELPAGFFWYVGEAPPPSAQKALIVINDRFVTWDGPAQTGRATYADRVTALREWAAENNLKVTVYRNRDAIITENTDGSGWEAYGTQPYRFEINTARRWASAYGTRPDVFGQDAEVCSCGETHELWAIRCAETGMPRCCPQCGTQNTETHVVQQNGYRWYCTNCGNRCGDCDSLIAGSQDYCSDCRDQEHRRTL
jgi:hypothetical protein